MDVNLSIGRGINFAPLFVLEINIKILFAFWFSFCCLSRRSPPLDAAKIATVGERSVQS
jgi:hypothetical protein